MTHRETKTRARRAFTLIEILIVVVILTTLATGVVLTLRGKPDEARVARAKSDIGALETALETFRLDMRRYPTEEEGLDVLVREPDSEDADRWRGTYVKRVPRDPWDHPYVYIYPGYYNTEGYDIMSYGADGQEGGEGFNADIGNWEEYEEGEPIE